MADSPLQAARRLLEKCHNGFAYFGEMDIEDQRAIAKLVHAVLYEPHDHDCHTRSPGHFRDFKRMERAFAGCPGCTCWLGREVL